MTPASAAVEIPDDNYFIESLDYDRWQDQLIQQLSAFFGCDHDTRDRRHVGPIRCDMSVGWVTLGYAI